MQTIRTVDELREYRQGLSGKVGLVPTMGALHRGHLKLIEECKSSCNHAIASIFVNPTQFNNPEDFKHYPRTEESDLHALASIGTDAVFIPDSQEMYPTQPAITIDFGRMASVLEGEHRPGHFEGVGLIVSKLFNIVSPDEAFFGEKDFQQLSLIRKLVQDLHFPIKIVSVQTIRQSDGLALSSRNKRLTDRQQELATMLFKSLHLIKDTYLEEGNLSEAKRRIQGDFDNQNECKLEYVEVVNSSNLEIIEQYNPRIEMVALIAAYVGEVRLIDNLRLN